MKNRQRQTGKKVWKSLKTMFKVLLILIILALLIQLISDFLHHYDFLIKKVTEQNDTISNLTQQVHSMADTNTQLSEHIHQMQSQLDLANMKIDDLTNEKLLQQAPQVNIGGQPVVMTPEDVKAEIEPQLRFPDTAHTLPAVLVGTFTVLKALAFRIVAF